MPASGVSIPAGADPARARAANHWSPTPVAHNEEPKYLLTSRNKNHQDHEPERNGDQGVAGQGVGDGGHGPDGQVPPARRGGDRVHEHAGPDRGQVQRPGAERAAAVQGQGDAQAGEDQGGGVGDGGLEGGDGGQVAGGVDHPVLGGEAHRRGGRGQDAQPGGGVAQPQARPVTAGHGASEVQPGRVARIASVGEGRAGQCQRESGCRGEGAARQVDARGPGVGCGEQDPGTGCGVRLGCTETIPSRGGFRCRASQDASQGQDAVTTRQDCGWTCRDVPAKVKPSFHVLRAG